MNRTPDTTRDALVAAILAHPEEDTPRLVYADYIEEHGDAHRAEFIRLQCRLARINPWDDGYTASDVRCRRLLLEHPEWLNPVRELNADLLGQCGSLRTHTGCGSHSVFRRGFPGVVAAQAEWFANSCADLFARFPIEGIGFNLDYAAARDALADCPGLARLRGLGISLWGEEREGLESLAQLRHVENVRHLEVYSEAVVADPLQSLLESQRFAGLESFALWSDCGDYGPRQPEDIIRELDQSSWLFGLHDLTLDGNVFEGLGDRLGRDSNWAPRLRRVALRGYLGDYGQIAPEAVARVAAGLRSGWFANVRDLDLIACDFEGLVLDALAAGAIVRPLRLTLPERNRQGYQEGMEARPGLLATDYVSEVRVLHIGGPGEAEIQELLVSKLSRQLRVLELQGRSLTGGRLRALLAVQGGWPHLERLNVSHNPIPDGALKEFLALGDRFPRLVSLAVGNGEPAPKFLARLAESPASARFRELDLRIPLDSAGADALARSPYLADLDLLSVIAGSAGRTALDRLKEKFGARLTLEPNPVQ